VVNRNKTVRAGAFAALLFAAGAALAAGGPQLRLGEPHADIRDTASLQNGAKLFVNYCLSCHGAQYMRYNRLTELGLSADQVVENFIFVGGKKIGDTMTVALTKADGKAWFGAQPPDLSVIARVRGTDWLYGYLRSFYRDPQTATGWNNLVFPNVGMPHALWELSGESHLVVTELASHEEATGAFLAAHGVASLEEVHGKGADGKTTSRYVLRTLSLDRPGTMSANDYDRAVSDLVNYLDYMGEPGKAKREQIGIVVLIFLGVFFVLALWLKREYWKDVH
jgi:ubiquinol-cytochrome c reductase cytochrome c1 subunit